MGLAACATGLQDMQSSDLAEGMDVSTDMGTGGMDSGHAHMKMTEALFTGFFT
jgi:hypothetical protein